MIGLTFSASFGQSSRNQQEHPDSHYFSFLGLNSAVLTMTIIAKLFIWNTSFSSIADSILVSKNCNSVSWNSCAVVITFGNQEILFFAGIIYENQKDKNFDPPFLLTNAADPVLGISEIFSLTCSLITLVTNLLLTALIDV
ncbi:hypothetical protein BDP27DRAFT_1366415 [Rhodocollybia butyracea]|uniref:Uncharacterized protein n=1 Tax=Rhodocollybia butyracea TaxID=206335 RepID=A0A9P5U3X9_9AGAR|nr:hypothetical protein BDP27DRAFT_1366415 [Rhodocollybia butyracea]